MASVNVGEDDFTACTTCGKPIEVGELRRHEEHYECYRQRVGEPVMLTRTRARRKRNDRPADIKAPDGYVLGGMRRIGKDGTFRISGSFYQCPPEWAGQWRHVHINYHEGTCDVAPEGVGIFTARMELTVYVADPADKADPKNRRVENMKKRGQWHMD